MITLDTDTNLMFAAHFFSHFNLLATHLSVSQKTGLQLGEFSPDGFVPPQKNAISMPEYSEDIWFEEKLDPFLLW